MSNITTPEAATPPVETNVVDMSQTLSSADEATAPDTVSLDPSVNREPAGHSFRGELFLSEAELGSVCEALQESGFAFEEVKTPPASPRAELSFAAAVSARRRTRESTAAARSSSTVDGVSDSSPALRRRSAAGKRKRGENAASLPDSPSSSMKMSTVDEQKTGQSLTPRRASTTKKSSAPVNVSAAPTTASGSPILMSGKDPGARIMMPRGAVSKMGEDGAHFRSVFLGVLNTIEADQGFSGADSIPYWFSHPVLPRQIEGVSFSACQLPINLGHVRHMVEEGKYNTHLELERDLRRLVRFALRNYPKTSQPFKAAERLNKLCTELMFDASYRIGNAEYVEAQYPAIEEPPEATPTSSTHRHQASGGGKAGSHKGSKQPVAHKSKDKESVKESRKKSKISSGGSKASESELTAQIEQLQDRISELTQFVSNLSETPRASGGSAAKENSAKVGAVGGARGPALPLTAEEKVKLEEDMNQLTPEDLCQVVDKKLRNCPGVVLDPTTGILQELDVDMMAPRDQRNLKRYVARLLNLRNQKVKENEERAREIVAQQRALAQLQEAQRRRRANSSSSSSSSSRGSSSSDSSSDEESERETELNRLFRKGTAVSAPPGSAR
ncbi:hypothetical protein FOL46_007060 [Perkinsus olseni]|nr:hypothetical protein FOL46_007060 [Perkinsus olseni]